MQIPLPFPQRDVGAEGTIPFYQGAANAPALGFLEQWAGDMTADPATLGVMITGACGAGKSRLAQEFGAPLQALGYIGSELGTLLQSPLTGPAYIIDDCERCAPSDLMGLINHCLAQGYAFILTGTGAPGKWAGDLVDLQTRLSALPQILLDLPDEDLLAKALKAFLARRQVQVRDGAIADLLHYMRRDFNTAEQLAELVDKKLLSSPGSISRSFVQDIFSEHPELKA